MTEVIGVKFNNGGKHYYFSPNGVTVRAGDSVIVETSRGLELGTCVQGNHEVPDEAVVQPLRELARLATKDDLRVAEINKKREAEAFEICKQKIEEHGLDMKLVDVECSFEGNKILFFFTSDGRVDFRELVKDLASVFRSRIELRQIGVRDEAKMLGGIGICGRPFCCNQFLSDFHPVSTKMAKVQSMSLNPAKISGACGRLMCCLRYEQAAYEELVKAVPKVGAFVETPAGYGTVASVNILRSSLKVKLDGEGEDVFRSYEADEIAVIPGGRPKPGESLPSLLKDRPRPKREPERPEEDPWAAPQLFAEDTDSEERAPEEPKKKRARRTRAKKPADAAASPERQTGEKQKAQAQGAKRARRGGRRHRKPNAAAQGKPGAEAKQTSETKPAPEHREQRKPSGGSHRRSRPKNPGAEQSAPPSE